MIIQCNGQLSLLDMLEQTLPPTEPPVLLVPGEIVYKVVLGDIEQSVVTPETWLCGRDNRGYRLKKENCWDVTWNTQINKVVFTTPEPAMQVAGQYLKENEHILAKDICATKVEAYQCEYDSRTINNFYALLENGTVYFHYGSMYEHIGCQKEINSFEENRKRHVNSNGYIELTDYKPKYSNMYKFQSSNNWLYAAARYKYR